MDVIGSNADILSNQLRATNDSVRHEIGIFHLCQNRIPTLSCNEWYDRLLVIFADERLAFPRGDLAMPFDTARGLGSGSAVDYLSSSVPSACITFPTLSLTS